MPNRILVVDDDPVNQKLVVIVLKQAGYETFTANTGADALNRVEEIRPDLIISDVEMPEMNGYELTRQLRQKTTTAHSPIMILTSHDTVQEKIKGFEAGADDYMTKPFEPSELQARVRVLLRRVTALPAETHKIKGKVIAVFSLRGGIGTSTIAANLATGLAQLWGCGTGLIDLVLTSGQSALMLNLPLRKTWADLARLPVEEIDAELIERVSLSHRSGAFVLAAPNRPEQAELITGDKVAHVITTLRERYHYLVLDLPHDFSATTLAGLDNADEILLVLAPELASLHAAACALDVFDTLKYPRQIIRLVLNWTFERRGLARKEIEDALQRLIDVVLPFAPDAFVPAINRGVPPVLETPPTPLAALFEDWAYALSQPEHHKPPPATPSPAYQRVAARLAQRQAKR
ncbi:MAG: response regulator [Chloroflexi bacterium]|nr:response regulator [Chloroflexota bacterium]